LAGSPEPEIINSILDLSVVLRTYISHAPKHEKNALCLRIMNNVDEFFELIVDAQFSRGNQRVTLLKRADKTLNRVKFQMMQYNKHGYFKYKHNRRASSEKEAQRRYKNIQTRLTSIGSQLGGWLSHEVKNK